jgi:hypothetical protein
MTQSCDIPDFDDEEMVTCPRCMGLGSIDCHCGGDLCVCENYGERPCPTCHGRNEVSLDRYERYFGRGSQS